MGGLTSVYLVGLFGKVWRKRRDERRGWLAAFLRIHMPTSVYRLGLDDYRVQKEEERVGEDMTPTDSTELMVTALGEQPDAARTSLTLVGEDCGAYAEASSSPSLYIPGQEGDRP